MDTEEFAEDQKPSPPRILVGVDGSDDAMRAVMYALGTAERTGHDIWLVHAVDDGVLASGWGVVYDPTILSSVGEEALAVATGCSSAPRASPSVAPRTALSSSSRPHRPLAGRAPTSASLWRSPCPTRPSTKSSGRFRRLATATARWSW